MPREILKMSRKERKRLIVMQQVQTKNIKLVNAAEQMGVSYRQTKRIWARFKRLGAEGIVHGNRDRFGNRCLDPDFKARVLKLYREQYKDFGPTLASEKMAERQGIVVNRETLRRWIIVACLWSGRTAHRQHRKRRERRAHFGELVQFDGSHHAWFEDREKTSCLMVMVDDATGQTKAHMADGETIQSAFMMLRKWIEAHGVPEALYTDRKNIYVTDREPTLEEQRQGTGALTDFGRACHRLGIRIIAAHSAQAKGRVERMNGVFQDRFVKEMRLRKISGIDAANAILDDFSKGLDKRFAQFPLEEANRHKALPIDLSLDDALCLERTRLVQNDWTFSLGGKIYQIPRQPHSPRARKRVTIRQRQDGSLLCFYHGHPVRIEEVT